MVLFASSSAAQSFHDQSAQLALSAGAKKPLFGSIGPQTTETMTELGMKPDFEAAKPSLDALVEALIGRVAKKEM